MNEVIHKSPSVAIVGTEGAGKTVLTAVLAKRLGDPAGGMFLNPKGPKTLKHVERVWSILQGGDWPEGNPPAISFAPAYLADALEIGSTLKLTDELSPGIVCDPFGNFCVIMSQRTTIAAPPVANTEETAAAA